VIQKQIIMIKIGITGQSGFVGTHLFNTLGLSPVKFERISFEDAYFQEKKHLRFLFHNAMPSSTSPP